MLAAGIESRLRAAANTPPADVESAETIRRAFTSEVERLLQQADVFVLPTLPSLPTRIDEARSGVSVISMSSLIRPFNLSGHPALRLPVPVDGTSVKAGLQIVGRKGEDETVCAVAAHIEGMLKSNA